jgi:hypothetical protein
MELERNHATVLTENWNWLLATLSHWQHSKNSKLSSLSRNFASFCDGEAVPYPVGGFSGRAAVAMHN